MKSYTNLEQSKVLVELLPIDSADMFYADGERLAVWNNKDVNLDNEDIPSWSLAELLDVMPYELEEKHYLTIRKEGNEYCCCYEDVNGNSFTHTFGDNPIDACVEMIIRLHKGELLWARNKDFTGDEVQCAFEAGWDAGKQENEHLVWQISEANFEKGKEIGKKEIIEKACQWLEDNLVQCWIEDFLYVQFKHHEHQEKENVLANFRKAMEEWLWIQTKNYTK